MQELVDLVAGDVHEDAAIGIAVKEPVGPGRAVQPVWPHADGLNHAANGAFGDKRAGARDRRHLKPFGEIDHPHAPCALLRQPDLIKLRKGGAAGLVDHDMFACLHRLDGEARAIPRDGRDQDHIDGRVGKDLGLVAMGNFQKAFDEPVKRAGLALGPPGGKFGAGIDHVLRHAVDMAVIKPEGGETNGHGSSTGMGWPRRADWVMASITAWRKAPSGPRPEARCRCRALRRNLQGWSGASHG